MDAATLTEAAKGSKELKRYAVLGSTLGGGAVLATLVNKLTAEQLVYLTERMGGYLLLALVFSLVIYKVGSRMASAMFEGANNLGGIREGMGQMSSWLQTMAGKDDERAIVVESTLNHVAGETSTALKLMQQVQIRQVEQDRKIDAIHDFMAELSRRSSPGGSV